ncbi:putative maltase-glucoamylase 2 [Chionoecetes opilio]|uniref:Putative maltase-glucoamylase 2 n=1 Tax=Chionoecetes opilio TaxID=41210 RepID=A0A8J4YMH8_CHIOP|nr:putative maltase-glucoamylase 2 [Chionoecetes opilio]
MHGASVIRPLLNVFPDDLHARDVDDQFLWGDGVMVAPVLEQGATLRDVYFPEGVWYNLVEGNFAAAGPVTLSIDAPLEVLPLYVRSGVILPFQEPSINTVDSRQNPFGLTVALGMDGDAAGEIFWDSGDGEHAMGESYMCRLQYLNVSI